MCQKDLKAHVCILQNQFYYDCVVRKIKFLDKFSGYGIEKDEKKNINPIYRTSNSDYGFYSPCPHTTPSKYVYNIRKAGTNFFGFIMICSTEFTICIGIAVHQNKHFHMDFTIVFKIFQLNRYITLKYVYRLKYSKNPKKKRYRFFLRKFGP